MEWLTSKDILINIIKMVIMILFTYYSCIKITNLKIKLTNLRAVFISGIILIIVLCIYLLGKMEIIEINTVIYSIFIVAIAFSNNTHSNLGYSILITTISVSINQIVFYISAILSFIPYLILKIEDEFINFVIIVFIYIIILLRVIKIKRLKNGIKFLEKQKNNEYLNLIILLISIIVLFLVIVLSDEEISVEVTDKIGYGLIIFAIIMGMFIQKSLQLYYKQKMLVKDLEETKAELEEKNTRIKELENEIIKSGKKSHSISHRQKILEHKLEELNMKSEISEMDIKSRIEKVGKDIRKEPVIVLAKTGIVEIDDVLDYMKSECVKKKIDFQLQLSGNIYKMINNYVSKDELEILLADHIKNAIIAIEYSNNINKSILVRLGRLDGTYGLYVYDSGIEFEKETLLKLGKKPATTHKDSGGTGMGFMNTFDTLRKHNASFIIEEYGKPVTDNFTKVLKFKFDNKNEFKICTYRKEEIEKQDKEKILKVENLMF